MNLPLARAFRAARLALAFLTVIPAGPDAEGVTEDDLAASRYAYPVVGLAIGLMLAALSVGLERAGVAKGLAAFVIVAAGVAINGGLHLDGLADSSDGLFLWGDAARRLAVMRDPHVGSFGVATIVLVLLGKSAALAELSGSRRALAVLGAAAVGRTVILVAAGLARYARPEGTGRVVIEAARPRDALGAAVVVLGLATLLDGRAGMIAGAACLALAWGLTRLAARQIGGVTGDILGALVELSEVVFLFILGSS